MGHSSEKSAQFHSKLTVWIAFCLCLLEWGFWIENVEESSYSSVVCFLIIYLTVGNVVMLAIGVFPASSQKILAGRVDVKWGLRNLYWTCWWPWYLKI
ncbi:MAG: hypothetical protein ABL911_04525 [Gallionella sp.]|nr:hypothetical protein [Gallionella sp.]